MLVIMVRGLFNSLKFPYAQFPDASTKGAQLFPLLYHCVFRLTGPGLTVVSVTCDGSLQGRSHDSSSDQVEFVPSLSDLHFRIGAIEIFSYGCFEIQNTCS